MFTKNSRNRYDKKDSLELGRRAEDSFARLAVKHGFKVTASSEKGNIDEHFDYVIERDGKSHKVDVKSIKRLSRRDSGTQDEQIWIELHGVRAEDKGWLYDGKADLIAFELTQSFRLVDRVELIALVEKLVNFDAKVSSPKDALYKVYSRQSRPDLLTMIKSEDLLQLRHAEWGK
ncbi:MAG TPA: hypothetical protein PKK96_11250 [Anaerolineales bacterium]|nr:hypothetical protein [Anaerolineales bacterium]HNQ96271.1 hypothetical protein [Anaerolineales bacterium]HNS61571.1 hypothetical protein [Anaerolineales bacterium]